MHASLQMGRASIIKEIMSQALNKIHMCQDVAHLTRNVPKKTMYKSFTDYTRHDLGKNPSK
jgi:hypothetical protein